MPQQSASTIATPSSDRPRGRGRGRSSGRVVNGAAAISTQANSRPTDAGPGLGAMPTGAPPSTGAIEKTSVDAEATKKPPQSRRSRRRPSTAKRMPASTATIAAASITAVSRTSRSCGQRVRWSRRLG